MTLSAWLFLLDTAAFRMEPIACFPTQAACVREGAMLARETFIPYGPPGLSVHCRGVARAQCPAQRPKPRH